MVRPTTVETLPLTAADLYLSLEEILIDSRLASVDALLGHGDIKA